MNSGQLFIISAPSGAGKTSMLKAARASLPNLAVAVSHTTRVMRPGEIDGQHYYFVNEDEFNTLQSQDAFVEHALVFGNYYGTSKQAINSLLTSGKDVVLEIDWQGARQIRDIYPDAVSVFILPPTLASLQQRLEERGQDSASVIATRMQAAKQEISHYDEYNHLIINDNFDTAVAQLIVLIESPHSYPALPAEQLATLLADI